MGAFQVVGAGLRLWSSNWVRWFVVTLLMTGAIAIVTAALDPWSATYGAPFWTRTPANARPDPGAIAVLLTLVTVFVLSPWELLILTNAALRATFSDAPRGSALIGRTIGKVHSILWIFFLLALLAIPLFLVLVGIADAMGSAEARSFLLFVPLALFVLIGSRLATLIHVFVGEDARGTKAITGAWRLSRGAWGTAAGTLALSFLVAIAVTIVPGLIVAEALPGADVADAVGRTVIQSLLNALVTPMGTAIVTALYLELRARAGVLDQASLRRNLARFD
ncbi:MAG: hypothetical protein ACRDG8_12580 [Actinomycetota bacterium]